MKNLSKPLLLSVLIFSCIQTYTLSAMSAMDVTIPMEETKETADIPTNTEEQQLLEQNEREQDIPQSAQSCQTCMNKPVSKKQAMAILVFGTLGVFGSVALITYIVLHLA